MVPLRRHLITGLSFLRFILSLASCKKCLVIDDQLNILPISSHAASIEALPPKSQVSTRAGAPGLGYLSGFLLHTPQAKAKANLSLVFLWQDDNLGPADLELKELKESLQDTQPVGVLVDCCRTLDQVSSGQGLSLAHTCGGHRIVCGYYPGLQENFSSRLLSYPE